MMRALAWVAAVVVIGAMAGLLFASCAKAAPVPPAPDPISAIYFDNEWGGSLLVCVQPEIPTWKVGYLCTRLEDLRRSLREVRSSRR